MWAMYRMTWWWWWDSKFCSCVCEQCIIVSAGGGIQLFAAVCIGDRILDRVFGSSTNDPPLCRATHGGAAATAAGGANVQGVHG